MPTRPEVVSVPATDATEVAVIGFQTAFVSSYGTLPAWITDLLSLLPSLLALCPLATPATVRAQIIAEPVSMDIRFRSLARSAGVPVANRGHAAKSLADAITATSDANLATLIAFSQSI